MVRLYNEKEIIKEISHPFIVKLHYTFQNKDKAYFILDLLSGGDLYTHINKYGKMKEAQARFYAAEIVLALEHLHKNKIVYRDLKPQNIVLDSEGHIKLTDFGLSKLNFDQNQENTICGTMKYIAPETISGQKYNHMIDWWSLGIILYRMLTAALPHPTKINKKIPYYIVNYKLPIDKNLFSKPAYDLIIKLLERDPKKRIGAKGAEEIMQHKFFKTINWKKLYDRQVKPPYVPNDKILISGKYTFIAYFNLICKQFWSFLNVEEVSGGIEDTPADNRHLSTSTNMENEYFEDFTYPKRGGILEWNEEEVEDGE